MREVDIAIIGGGPAGLATAAAAHDAGVKDILIIERDKVLGGVLNQCTHKGFGEKIFGKALTGAEFAQCCAATAFSRKISTMVDTTVICLTAGKVLTTVNSEGLHEIRAQAVVLATGCRERTRSGLKIPGSRPAGIITAGTAQKYINTLGCLPGRDVVILGSGDIALITARLLSLNGATVRAVIERQTKSPGLSQNIRQCLEAFGTELRLSQVVTQIEGRERVCGVYVAQVDTNLCPVVNTEEYIPCDTLIIAGGLIPENEIAQHAGVHLDPSTGGALVDGDFHTNIDGVFACGNALQIHHLVDHVSRQGIFVGRRVADYIHKKDPNAYD